MRHSWLRFCPTCSTCHWHHQLFLGSGKHLPSYPSRSPAFCFSILTGSFQGPGAYSRQRLEISLAPKTTSRLSFRDQCTFEPTGSTAAALIQLLLTIASSLPLTLMSQYMPWTSPKHLIVYSAVLNKFSRMNLPDNVYN